MEEDTSGSSSSKPQNQQPQREQHEQPQQPQQQQLHPDTAGSASASVTGSTSLFRPRSQTATTNATSTSATSQQSPPSLQVPDQQEFRHRARSNSRRSSILSNTSGSPYPVHHRPISRTPSVQLQFDSTPATSADVATNVAAVAGASSRNGPLPSSSTSRIRTRPRSSTVPANIYEISHPPVLSEERQPRISECTERSQSAEETSPVVDDEEHIQFDQETRNNTDSNRNSSIPLRSFRSSIPHMRRRAFSSAVDRFRRPTSAVEPNPDAGLEAELTPEERHERQQRYSQPPTYNQRVVDLLDVIDPEVSTMSTLSDLQNSLFIPDLGSLVNRTRPLKLTRPSTGKRRSRLEEEPETPQGEEEEEEEGTGGEGVAPKKESRLRPFRRTRPSDEESQIPPPEQQQPPSKIPEIRKQGEDEAEGAVGAGKQAGTGSLKEEEEEEEEEKEGGESGALTPKSTREGIWMILPDNICDEEWTDEQKAELDDYVRHLLHSKKEKTRRTLRSFRKYVSTPLGAFVTIYASLLTFWGAAWVLFLIGWINVGDRQDYFVEICDQVLTALFCVVGIGLIPWRSVDTYHMIYIAHYHRKSLKLYEKYQLNLPTDINDLPLARVSEESLDNASIHTVQHVLTPEEEQTFLHHQQKFAKSHTFYRPHETVTHKAFPIDLLITVVSLLDFHSCFQIALGSLTWSVNYRHEYRHTVTAVILSFSICCNVAAGLVITIGNRKTRKKDVIEKQLREAITQEAIHRKAKKQRLTEQHRDSFSRQDSNDKLLHTNSKDSKDSKGSSKDSSSDSNKTCT